MQQNVLNPTTLDDFRMFLIKNKYKNLIKELNLEYCTDDNGDYIQLNCIQIKKSQRNKGYGSCVMSDIVRLADDSNVRIKLWVTNIFGTELKVLYEFYRKHGFVLIKNDNDGHMIYYPNVQPVKNKIKK
ncbi:MAG TPA: GNAT family N-acetyltransferase [Lentimicrobium sp.]|nr:GNAT family N-acetyltransferase [Lentimicrobium sp.]